jgi:hypothetical protein
MFKHQIRGDDTWHKQAEATLMKGDVPTPQHTAVEATNDTLMGRRKKKGKKVTKDLAYHFEDEANGIGDDHSSVTDPSGDEGSGECPLCYAPDCITDGDLKGSPVNVPIPEGTFGPHDLSKMSMQARRDPGVNLPPSPKRMEHPGPAAPYDTTGRASLDVSYDPPRTHPKPTGGLRASNINRGLITDGHAAPSPSNRAQKMEAVRSPGDNLPPSPKRMAHPSGSAAPVSAKHAGTPVPAARQSGLVRDNP